MLLTLVYHGFSFAQLGITTSDQINLGGIAVSSDLSIVSACGQSSPIGTSAIASITIESGIVGCLESGMIHYPSNYSLTHTFSFPSYPRASDYLPTDYKLIGLPGSSGLLANFFLPGEQNKFWQIYSDNGASQNYLVQFDGSSQFKFEAGRSFWIIAKGGVSLNRTVPTVLLNNVQEAVIKLHRGPNLITNPFTIPISWSSVQAVNAVSESLAAFSNGFTIVNIMEPYKGYLFLNSTNLDSLRIPYGSSGVIANGYSNSKIRWQVSITLKSGRSVDRTNNIGVGDSVVRGYNKLNYHKPRGVGGIPSVIFARPEWDPEYPIFAGDYRPPFEDLETWEFSVESASQQQSQLIFSGIRTVPPEFQVYLIDLERSKFANLRKDTIYNFVPVSNSSQFRLLVGKSELIEERLAGVYPTSFALHQNFPNPFNPLTRILIDIPRPSNVELIVYNVLGQRVVALQSGFLEPGRYWYLWQGKNESGESVPSGVYLCSLMATNGIHLTKKMICLR